MVNVCIIHDQDTQRTRVGTAKRHLLYISHHQTNNVDNARTTSSYSRKSRYKSLVIEPSTTLDDHPINCEQSCCSQLVTTNKVLLHNCLVTLSSSTSCSCSCLFVLGCFNQETKFFRFVHCHMAYESISPFFVVLRGNLFQLLQGDFSAYKSPMNGDI